MVQGAFILGSARCGSTLVSDLLRLHPGLLSLSEVFSMAGPAAFVQGQISATQFWRGLSRPTRLGSAIGNPTRAPTEFLYGRQSRVGHDPYFCPPLLTIALPHLTDDPDALFDWLAPRVLAAPDQSAAAHYRGLFGGLAEAQGRRVWVERSGGSITATATLHQMFPDARQVLLTRSGIETVLSMTDYPATRLAVWMWKRLRPLGVDLLAPGSHYGRGRLWRILQPLAGVFPVGRILDRRPDPVDVARFWSAMMVNAAPALRALPKGSLHHLSYEELVADPRPVLTRLGQFLCADAPPDWLNAAGRLPQARALRSETLPPGERATLLAACAPGEAALDGVLAAR